MEESLQMKVANFRCFGTAMDESTDVSDTAQLAAFVSGIDTEFNLTEESAALMPMGGTTTGATSGTGDGWGTKRGGEEQWCVLAYQQRREE